MKKILFILLAAFASNMLFALSISEVSAMLKSSDNTQVGDTINNAKTAQASKPWFVDSTDYEIRHNSVVKIEASFDYESKILEYGGRFNLFKDPENTTLKCYGILVKGGVVVLPRSCLAKKSVIKIRAIDRREEYTYTLKSVLLTFSDKGAALNVGTNTGRIHILGEDHLYAYITTTQKDRIKHIPKLGVFIEDYPLRKFLESSKQSRIFSTTGVPALFKTIDDNSAKCDSWHKWCVSYGGPLFFEDNAVGMLDDNIFYGIPKKELPKAVLNALGSDGIKIITKSD